MTKPSRIILAIAVAFFFAAIHGLSAGSVLPRENINTFSQDPVKLKKLRDAVAALQDRNFDSSVSWFTLAGIHDILPNDPDLASVPVSIKALFHQCHTDESLFFLWHRAYVAAVERLMQDAIGDQNFRLPYWNWYADPSLPEAFRNEFLDAQRTQKNSLYRVNRNRAPNNVNGGAPIWTPVVVTDYSNDSFETFQEQLNQNEHGDIHVFVGTRNNMGSIFFAARDPIFYLHHANIDRLLMVWLKNNPNAHKVPVNFPNWLTNVYRFPIPPGSTGNANPLVYTPTAQELALGSMEAMGYKYDDVDLPTPSTPPVPTAPPNLQASAVEGAKPKESKLMQFAVTGVANKPLEIGAGGTVQLSVPANQKERITTLANMTPAPRTTQGLSLVFENIHLKEPPPGLASYRVFVNLPKQRASTEVFRDHFVGTLSLFSLQHAETHGQATIRLHFSPTQGAPALMKSLKSEGKEPSKISVSLVPVLAPGASAPKSPVLTIGQIRLEGSVP